MGAVTREAMLQSALLSAARAEEMGLGQEHRIILSAKVSAVQQLVAVYKMLAARSTYAIHLGLTEAGMGSKGIVASAAALGVLLQEGIGDTIRVSLTPEPNGDRTVEVKVAQEILQTMGFRTFVPLVAACPGCGRTTSTVFQELARDIQNHIRDEMPNWKTRYPGVETLERRGDGLHRQRPRRIQACRYRHLAAGYRRDAGCPGLHRRQEGADLARDEYRQRIQGSRGRLHRAPVRDDRHAERCRIGRPAQIRPAAMLIVSARIALLKKKARLECSSDVRRIVFDVIETSAVCAATPMMNEK